MRIASLSVDLDSLPHYCRIHGLPEIQLDERLRTLVYTTAIPRFLELFAGVPATFFAIGEDLDEPSSAAALRRAFDAGVEIGNHSHRHRYELSRLPAPEIRDELRLGAAAIARATGRAPVGFRAPGYTLSGALYSEIEQAGYLYDSSAFPATPYYLAKAGVMGLLSLLGRPSRAVLDSPRVLSAPPSAYFPDPSHPYRRGRGQTLELPITVEPRTHTPFIGTVAVAFPRPLLKTLYRMTRGVEHFNFELHGIDVLGVDDGFPPELLRQQRDLGLPVKGKLARLAEVFAWIREDFDVVTLEEAARRVGAV
ncbi:MAG: polysaccharide deacetylase family protein [Myxococcaceae bacterium]